MKLGPASNFQERSTVIKSVCENLQGTKKRWKILPDKIHIKLEVQYQRGRLRRFSVDEPENPAKSILVLTGHSFSTYTKFSEKLIFLTP